MPPPSLTRIARLRASLATASATATSAGRELAEIRLRRDAAVRAGASRREADALDAFERAAQRRLDDAIRDRDRLGVELPGLIDALAQPDEAIGRLETGVPVTMLPVRIETRFETPQRLLVRIYPDQIHLRTFDGAVTDAEVQAGRRYWERAWAGVDDAGPAWDEIAASLGPERAAYLIDLLRPLNVERRPHDAPQFRDIETVQVRGTVPTEARLLPSRWLVTLLAADGTRMARRWAAPIPERLPMAPFGDPAQAEAAMPEGELAMDDGARWLVDFERAKAVGMAIAIDEADLEAGRFADGISRLIVVGADWSRTPEEAAAALHEQLCAHGYTDGFGFLASGTVTNNTASRSADLHSDDRARRTAFPAVPPASTEAETSAGGFARALGLPDAVRLARFPGGTADCERTVEAVHGALWGAAFGFYLSEVMRPLVSDGRVASVRRLLREHVRPAGPIAAIRVGRQPYGVLPVLSTPVVYESPASFGALRDPFERDLAQVLARMRVWVERPVVGGVGKRTLDEVATMAAIPPGTDPGDHLAAILKQGPVSMRAQVRATVGRARRDATNSLAAAQQTHAEIVRLVLAALGVPLGGAVVFDPKGGVIQPAIFDLVSPSKPKWSLGALPWVAADLSDPAAVRAATDKVAARIREAVADPARVRRLLAVSAEGADTLLEGLLLLSAAFEYWRAGERIVADPGRDTVVAGSLLGELSAVLSDPPPDDSRIAIDTPRQMLQLEAGAFAAGAGRSSLVSHIYEAVSARLINPPLRDARDFHDALATLAERPAMEVDQALRGLLDLGSHRLDAWITAVATRRLRSQRGARAIGMHLGGYGIVHDLRPDTAPDSEGYVHVPSTDHAVTAAVLRAGHAANRDDEPEAFAIRLTSERVRDAQYLTEGMAQGQRLSALLGYRFERWLVDGRLQARYINAFRRFAPHPTDPAPGSGARESIAARDVVDGQRLAEAWHARGAAIFPEVAPLVDAEPRLQDIAEPDRTALAAHLDRLVGLFDAFLDLWTTESVHQLGRGNPDRAAAALAVIDRQERPMDPQAVRTPRGAWGYVQRLMCVLPADARSEGWPRDLASRVEPGADALAARLIGEPSRFTLTARVVGADGAPLARPILRAVTVSDLGLSALSMAMMSERTGHDRPTRLEERLVAAFVAQAELPEGARIDLGAEPDDADRSTYGLPDLLALLGAVRRALFDRRALSQRDFSPPSGVAEDRVVVQTVAERAALLEAELAQTERALADALGNGAAVRDAAAAVAALRRASSLIPVPWWCHARAPAADDPALADALRAAQSTIGAVRARWTGIIAVPPRDEASNPQAEAESQAEADVQRIRSVFGPSFPVLPPFTVDAPIAAQWRAGLADQDASWRSHSRLALVQWLRTLSLVRPAVRALTDALDAAAWTGHAEGAGEARAMQWPHVAGRRWVGLPFDRQPPDDVRMSGVLLGELTAGGAPMCGVLLDEWTEAIPEARRTTSVAFQYDAPAARPPQMLCIAVDAGVSGGGWTADALVATVGEMFDLARLRLVTPQQIAGHGAVLPTMFVPRNLSEEGPSFDLVGRIESIAARVADAVSILGKD